MSIEDGRQPVPEKELDQQAGAGSSQADAPAAVEDGGAAAAPPAPEAPAAEAAAPEPVAEAEEAAPGRQPKVGDVVLYQVADSDEPNTKHNGAVILPAVVTAVWGPACANLKLLTDGPVNTWKTSALRGDGPGQWAFRD